MGVRCFVRRRAQRQLDVQRLDVLHVEPVQEQPKVLGNTKQIYAEKDMQIQVIVEVVEHHG